VIDILDVLTSDHQKVDLEVAGKQLRLTSLDRVLWPRTGNTKRDLLRYYVTNADRLLPWIEDRPLTLFRCPDGVEANCWYQTTCPHPPRWLRRQRVPAAPAREYCVIDDIAGLLWAGNLSSIELHRLQSKSAALEQPTDLVFDLDPGPDAGLKECAAVARLIRHQTVADGAAIAVASGSLGIHVYIPLTGRATYAQAKATARSNAEALTREHPDLVTVSPRRAERGARVYVDWAQNDINRSLVAPFSLRAMPVPSSARLMEWDEVDQLAKSGRLG